MKISAGPPVGVRGVGKCLEALDGTNVKAVAIGGIKSANLLRTLHGSVSPTYYTLDGIAVVSAIFASSKPQVAAREMLSILRAFRQNHPLHIPSDAPTEQSIIEGGVILI